MLVPQTMSEKMMMNVMVVSSRAWVPLPVSPSTCERSTAIRKLMTAAVILVPKVLMIFLNMPLTRFGDYLMSMTSTLGWASLSKLKKPSG